jgi:very-short-patch-repair endonuclease
MLINGELYNCSCCGAKNLTKDQIVDHIKIEHSLKFKQYYEKYLLQPDDGKCVICNEPTTFKSEKRNFGIGYLKYCKSHSRGYTLEKSIVKYGPKVGKEKFEQYVQKHRFKNTFEGKQLKYGWSKEQFAEFNKSRSVTYETMCKKYGSDEGAKKFKEYCEVQRHAGCSKEYFVDKYGELDGTAKYIEVNKKKSHSYESYLEKYKDPDIARQKLIEFREKGLPPNASKVSQSFFSKIVDVIGTDNIYFSKLNKEFGMMGDREYYFYDFCDTLSKTILEFHGNKFHVKDPTEDFVQLYSGKSKEFVMEHDRKKEECARNRGFNYIVVWEDEYMKNRRGVIDDICRQITELRRGII